MLSQAQLCVLMNRRLTTMRKLVQEFGAHSSGAGEFGAVLVKLLEFKLFFV